MASAPPPEFPNKPQTGAAPPAAGPRDRRPLQLHLCPAARQRQAPRPAHPREVGLERSLRPQVFAARSVPAGWSSLQRLQLQQLLALGSLQLFSSFRGRPASRLRPAHLRPAPAPPGSHPDPAHLRPGPAPVPAPAPPTCARAPARPLPQISPRPPVPRPSAPPTCVPTRPGPRSRPAHPRHNKATRSHPGPRSLPAPLCPVPSATPREVKVENASSPGARRGGENSSRPGAVSDDSRELLS